MADIEKRCLNPKASIFVPSGWRSTPVQLNEENSHEKKVTTKYAQKRQNTEYKTISCSPSEMLEKSSSQGISRKDKFNKQNCYSQIDKPVRNRNRKSSRRSLKNNHSVPRLSCANEYPNTLGGPALPLPQSEVISDVIHTKTDEDYTLRLEREFPSLTALQVPKSDNPTPTPTPLSFAGAVSVSLNEKPSRSGSQEHVIEDEELKPGWVNITKLRERGMAGRSTGADSKAETRNEFNNVVRDDVQLGVLQGSTENIGECVRYGGLNSWFSSIGAVADVERGRCADPSTGSVPDVMLDSTKCSACEYDALLRIRTSAPDAVRTRWDGKWLALAMEYTARKLRNGEVQPTSKVSGKVISTDTRVTPTDVFRATGDKGLERDDGSLKAWHKVLAPPLSTQYFPPPPKGRQNCYEVREDINDKSASCKGQIVPLNKQMEYTFDSRNSQSTGGVSGSGSGNIYCGEGMMETNVKMKSTGRVSVDDDDDGNNVCDDSSEELDQDGVGAHVQGQPKEGLVCMLLEEWDAAVTMGNLLALQDLLNKDCDQLFAIDSVKCYRSTTLLVESMHKMCLMGHAASLEWLLKTFRLDIDAKNSDKISPVLTACVAGNIECVRVLVMHGASLDVRDRGAENVLHKAARSGNRALVTWLCDKKRLSSKNLNSRNKRRETPLMLAALCASRDVIVDLIGAGADPSCRDVDGLDAACLAVRRGDIGVLEAILMCNNRNSRHGNSSVSRGASSVQQLTVVRLHSNRFPATYPATMLSVRPDTTPLHQAALTGSVRCVRLLIRNGCPGDLASCDSPTGCTPLMYACSMGHVDAVRELTCPMFNTIKSGIEVTAAVTASMTTEDSRGCTALVYAVKGRNAVQCTRLLIEFGTFCVRHSNRVGESVLEAVMRRDRFERRTMDASTLKGFEGEDVRKETHVSETIELNQYPHTETQITPGLVTALALLLKAGAPLSDRFLQRLSGGSITVSGQEMLTKLTSRNVDKSSMDLGFLPWNRESLSVLTATNESSYTDVCVVLADHQLRLHAFVVGSLSLVLSTMISSDLAEIDEQTGDVVLRFPHHEKATFGGFVEWMYTGKDVTEAYAVDDLVELLVLANEFLVDSLQVLCERRLLLLHLLSHDHSRVDRKLLESLCDMLPLSLIQSFLNENQGTSVNIDYKAVPAIKMQTADDASLGIVIDDRGDWYSAFRQALLRDAPGCDSVLITEDGSRFRVHRAVVASHSPKLAAMLGFLQDSARCSKSESPRQSSSIELQRSHRYRGHGGNPDPFSSSSGTSGAIASLLELHLHGITGESLNTLLSYMYCGRLMVPKASSTSVDSIVAGSKQPLLHPPINAAPNDQAIEEQSISPIEQDFEMETDMYLNILWAADEYLMEHLRGCCVRELATRITAQTVEAIFMTADALGLCDLRDYCAVRILSSASSFETELCERALVSLAKS